MPVRFGERAAFAADHDIISCRIEAHGAEKVVRIDGVVFPKAVPNRASRCRYPASGACTFSFKEDKRKLQLLGEAYNLTNTVVFANPNATCCWITNAATGAINYNNFAVITGTQIHSSLSGSGLVSVLLILRFFAPRKDSSCGFGQLIDCAAALQRPLKACGVAALCF